MNRAILAAATSLALFGSTAVAHADTYNDLFYWVDWMANKYNMGIVYVSQEPLSPGVYGVSSGRTVTFNSLYVNNPAKLEADLASDVAHGFHPGFRCSATQIVAAHESAHVLDAVTGHRARYELNAALQSGLSGDVSGYSFNSDGSVNIGEALADAMVAVECDNPTSAELALYEMLVR